MIKAQGLQITLLREQVALLQKRLKLDSRNSSKPPSSDGPAVGSRAQRRASTRKRGAQVVHTGSFPATLEESQVDSIVEYPAPPVYECGEPVQADGKSVRRQVFDVPLVKARVDEYRSYSGRCTGYGRPHRAALPPGVPNGQIGPCALALVGVLGTRYHLRQQRPRDLLAQLMGMDFSVGATSQAHGKVAQALKGPLAEAAATLCHARVVHLDETHYSREGSANWVWAVVQPSLVVYSVSP